MPQRTLCEFWECPEYADSRDSLEAWYREAVHAKWSAPMEIKAQYGNANVLEGEHIMFNISGNKYCLLVKINYTTQTVFIRFIGTHRQYVQIDAERI
jgi:mRNA interferase HigB